MHEFDKERYKQKSQSLWNRAMSFDKGKFGYWLILNRSQSLWNRAMSFDAMIDPEDPNPEEVSIPLEQGNVFRLTWLEENGINQWSQSLWNRAMSFDSSGVFKPCVARLPRATSQLFLMPEELGINLIKY